MLCTMAACSVLLGLKGKDCRTSNLIVIFKVFFWKLHFVAFFGALFMTAMKIPREVS